jgi:NADPH-dependent 2,4-dienoyl-CoA reductase/sulfur reductase-like enzyme
MLSRLYKNILVIGGNASGLAAASQARRENPDADITVLESGDYISYGSCGLPYYVSGIVRDFNSLFTYSPSYFEEKRKIRILKNHRVVSINTFKKEVIANIFSTNTLSANMSPGGFSTGDSVGRNENASPGGGSISSNNISFNSISFTYDRLVICSGASPVIPDIPGINAKGVFSFWAVKDAVALKKYIETQNPKQAVIIGSGSVGLLMAEAMAGCGLKVTIVETKNRVFEDYEVEIASVLEEKIRNSGIQLLTSYRADSINYNRESGQVFSVSAVSAKSVNGEKIEIEAQVVIVAAGIAPNTGFLESSSIEINKNKAIKVSLKQQTSQANVFSAGDCSVVKNIVTGSWDYIPSAGNAIKAGRVAGANAAGADEIFEGSVATKVDKIFGIEIARTGVGLAKALDYRFNAFKITDNFSSHAKSLPGAENITITLIVDIGTRRILGAQMAGKDAVGKRIDIFAAAITNEMTVDKVYMLDLSYAPSIATAPDAITRICGKAISMLKSIRF